MKRSRSSTPEETGVLPVEKRRCPQTDLLTALTKVLSEIRSTPSTGEISAEVMETFKILMLQIEELSSDEEGKMVKDETERCLETWLEDLVAQCEADGELLDDFDDEDGLMLALALDETNQQGDTVDDDDVYSEHYLLSPNHHLHLHIQEDEDEDDDEEIIVVDDDDTLDTHHIQVMA
ncbi:hypothetical protein BC941DRAFT_425820 [Chlamydoabsidia padenii]|nr:hypothetical protein BC941DRAFT_425820 [Chlamydoabsidia padenii]